MYHKLFMVMTGKDGNSERFIAGAVAGVTATVVCFPLDVLRTRILAPGGHKYGGPLKTLYGMTKHEGLGALYTGERAAALGDMSRSAFYCEDYKVKKAAAGELPALLFIL